MTLLCAVMLVMVGFGYLQHLVSFSIVGGGSGYGIIIQVARGVVALLMFAIVVGSSQRVSTVYRVGLLAMIAGFMMMPFLFGTNLFWVSGSRHYRRLYGIRPPCLGGILADCAYAITRSS